MICSGLYIVSFFPRIVPFHAFETNLSPRVNFTPRCTYVSVLHENSPFRCAIRTDCLVSHVVVVIDVVIVQEFGGRVGAAHVRRILLVIDVPSLDSMPIEKDGVNNV